MKFPLHIVADSCFLPGFDNVSNSYSISAASLMLHSEQTCLLFSQIHTWKEIKPRVDYTQIPTYVRFRFLDIF